MKKHHMFVRMIILLVCPDALRDFSFTNLNSVWMSMSSSFLVQLDFGNLCKDFPLLMI